MRISPPLDPIASGRFITWRDRKGWRDRPDDREGAGYVHRCHWTDKAWNIELHDGTVVPLTAIDSVCAIRGTGVSRHSVVIWQIADYDGQSHEGWRQGTKD